MIRKFVDRSSELNFLEDTYKKGNLQVIIIYGRRRVGKTELIKRFIENKDSIYFLADQRGTEKNLERFARSVQTRFSLPPLKIESFEDVFKIIADRAPQMVVVIDEFSYLIENDPALASVFQFIIDEVLKETNAFLVLCGSSISMMEKGVLSYKSPLYGRRTGQIKLKPVEFRDLREFFPDYSIEQLIEAYAVLGGVPAYLNLFDPMRDLFENIRSTFFVREHLFYQEPEIILREELREPKVYFNLLEAMARGKTRLTDIANAAGIDAKDASSYVRTLIELDLVGREYPVTEKKPKRPHYHIKDNFFTFWFRFVLGNRELIERGQSELLLDEVKRDFSRWVSWIFEWVCMDFLWIMRPFPIDKIGRWWYKEEEIDLVALNDETKEILFAECKWQSKKIDTGVIERLREKSKLVYWNNDIRKEHFALFSKSGFTKSCLDHCKKEGIKTFDLKDIERIFR